MKTDDLSKVPQYGRGNAVFVGATDQPGTAFTETKANGESVGSAIVRPTVPAVGDSLGTRKVSLVKPPALASDGFTDTCAEATPAPATRAIAVNDRVVMTRRQRGARGLVDMRVPSMLNGRLSHGPGWCLAATELDSAGRRSEPEFVRLGVELALAWNLPWRGTAAHPRAAIKVTVRAGRAGGVRRARTVVQAVTSC